MRARTCSWFTSGVLLSLGILGVLSGCGESAPSAAPASGSGSPAAAEPVSSPPTSRPTSPPTSRPASPEPRLRIGSTRFYAPDAARAVVAVEGRLYVARDGERIEVWTREGTLEASFELAPPPAPAGTSGLGTGLGGGPGGVQALDVRGERIAIALGGHGARVLSREGGREIFALADVGIVHDVVLLPDGALASASGGEAYANGHHIVEASGPCGLCLWSAAGERRVAIAPADAGGWVTAIAATGDGAAIVTGASDGRLRVYDAAGALVREIRTGDRRVERIAFVAGEQALLYANDVGDVARVGLDGRGRRALFRGDEVTQAVALSEARIAWAGSLGPVQVLSGDGGRLGSFDVSGPSALAVDGEDVLVGDYRGHVRRWHEGAFVPLDEPGGGVGDVLWTDGGAQLVVRSGTELRVYRAADGALEHGPRTLPEFTCAVRLLAGDRLVVQRDAISLTEEDLVGAGHARRAGSGAGSSINHLDVSRDARVLAYATYDRVRVGSTSVRVEGGVRALALSDDGSAFAMTTQGETPGLAVHDASSGAERWHVTLEHVGSALAWRGDTLAVAREEGGAVELRDAADGSVRALVALDAPAEGAPPPLVAALTLSPDASTLGIAMDDGALLVADAATGAVRWRARAHRGPLTSIAFSPDGAELATGSLDGTVLVWRVARD